MQSKVLTKIETGLLQNLICAAAKMWSKRTDALSLKVKVYMILLKGWMMTADWCVRTAFELEKRGRGISFPVCRSQEWQDVDWSGAKIVDPASALATLQCSVFTIDQTTLPCANLNTVSLTRLVQLHRNTWYGVKPQIRTSVPTISSVATSVTLESCAL